VCESASSHHVNCSCREGIGDMRAAQLLTWSFEGSFSPFSLRNPRPAASLSLSSLSPRALQACIPTCSRDGIALPQAATLPAGFLPSRGNWESWDAWRLAGTAGGTHALCGGAGCRAGRLASSPVNLGSTSLVLTCHSPVFSVQQLAWCVYVHHLFLLVCSA